MQKYAKNDIKSYVNSSVIRAKRGDLLTVYKIDGHIAYCVNGGVAFTTTLEQLSDEYVAAAPPETKIAQPKKRK